MGSFSSTLADFFGPALTVFVVIFVLILANIFLNRKLGEKTEKIFQKQLIMLVLTLFGAMIFIISLPISDTLRGQILGVFGILASATLASVQRRFWATPWPGFFSGRYEASMLAILFTSRINSGVSPAAACFTLKSRPRTGI